MKTYTSYIQLGDEDQCRENGLSAGRQYMIGTQTPEIRNMVGRNDYVVRGAFGFRSTWNIEAMYRTNFKLILIY